MLQFLCMRPDFLFLREARFSWCLLLAGCCRQEAIGWCGSCCSSSGGSRGPGQHKVSEVAYRRGAVVATCTSCR
jgi:hypothetical protein